ncbi:hypothetical protein GQ42DRAFT_159977 [Ramicandelaber brevisporus]|nr:hypothetical protein GQ42DRAFT_159977 [Ramicandelaber brevisporus]
MLGVSRLTLKRDHGQTLPNGRDCLPDQIIALLAQLATNDSSARVAALEELCSLIAGERTDLNSAAPQEARAAMEALVALLRTHTFDMHRPFHHTNKSTSIPQQQQHQQQQNQQQNQQYQQHQQRGLFRDVAPEARYEVACILSTMQGIVFMCPWLRPLINQLDVLEIMLLLLMASSAHSASSQPTVLSTEDALRSASGASSSSTESTTSTATLTEQSHIGQSRKTKRNERTDAVTIAILETLMASLVGCPAGLREFERLSGPRKVFRLLKNGTCSRAAKHKALTFLYIYLLPEESDDTGCGSDRAKTSTATVTEPKVDSIPEERAVDATSSQAVPVHAPSPAVTRTKLRNLRRKSANTATVTTPQPDSATDVPNHPVPPSAASDSHAATALSSSSSSSASASATAASKRPRIDGQDGPSSQIAGIPVVKTRSTKAKVDDIALFAGREFTKSLLDTFGLDATL